MHAMSLNKGKLAFYLNLHWFLVENNTNNSMFLLIQRKSPSDHMYRNRKGVIHLVSTQNFPKN